MNLYYSTPLSLELLAVILVEEDTTKSHKRRNIERTLHDRLREFRYKGEWFHAKAVIQFLDVELYRLGLGGTPLRSPADDLSSYQVWKDPGRESGTCGQSADGVREQSESLMFF